MFEAFNVPLSWGEIVKRTVRETMRDDGLALAAQLAFYFFLALFPTLLALLAIASLLPMENLAGTVTDRLAPVAPPDVVQIIRDQMVAIGQGDNVSLIGIGFLGAIWSSSAALVAVIAAMNKAYDIEDSRPWWRVRLSAILLTILLAVFVVLSFVLIVAGPEIAQAAASRFGLGGVFVWTWSILRWPIAFLLVSFGIGLVYYMAPDAEQDWVWITPGSLLATALWVLASLGFRFYVINFGNYDAAYGTIGGIIVLMMWFYLSGFVVFVGAEMNAEIEHASPWGKAEGEKVPGKRRRLGQAAARAHAERDREGPYREPAPSPADRRPAAAAPGAAASSFRPAALGWMLAALTVGMRWRNRRG